jgi:predicted nucleotidyltransferase
MTIDEKHLTYWRSRRQQQQQRQQRLIDQTRQELPPIVEVLVTQFAAEQIILFGSLAKGNFAMESDIDLAVRGIASADYFAAVSAVNWLTNRWIDLKRWEDLEPHFQQRVLDTGEVIYARDLSQ